VGIDYLTQRHMMWVINFWQIKVDRRPIMGDAITVSTAPYELKSFMGLRNFWMQDAEGNYLVRANSVWTLIDTEKGRPVGVTQDMVDRYEIREKLEMDYAPRKIRVPEESEAREPILITHAHLDTNHHVNNGQYVTLAMNYLPEGFEIGELRAEYRRQVFLGDTLYPAISQTEDGALIVSMNDAEGKPYAVVCFIRN
jgi:acyl-ACP thioesterase